MLVVAWTGLVVLLYLIIGYAIGIVLIGYSEPDWSYENTLALEHYMKESEYVRDKITAPNIDMDAALIAIAKIKARHSK